MSATVASTARSRTRSRSWAVALGAAVVATVALVVLTTDDAATSAPLDPANPGPGGSRAVLRVLADNGVETSVARGADAFESTGVTDETTVVVSSVGDLGESTVRRLRQHAGSSLVVLLEPTEPVWDLVGVGSTRPVTDPGDLAADCDPTLGGGLGEAARLPGLLDGLVVSVDSATSYPGSGCLEESGRTALRVRDETIAFGAAQALTNGQVLRGDNAAVALRLLGGRERLVWYVADPADLAAGDAVGIAGLLPPWIVPALWLGLVVLAAVVLWRSRRLGPLSSEPLPVVVRAIETTQSRGRLYRSAGDRGHAARTLREASRRRLTGLLGLPPSSELLVVGTAAAARSGRDPVGIGRLLDPDAAPPASDADLITLAQDLDQLEREVHHR